MIRLAVCLLLPALLAAAPAFAQGPRAQLRPALAPAAVAPATLKSEVTATRDVLTFGDLIEGLPAAIAAQPAFRAPALGDTGTIQTLRIVEAARAQGVDQLADGGHQQVIVTRAARRLNAGDVEAAIRRALEERHGVDARAFKLVLDAGAPTAFVEPDMPGALAAQEITYDPRNRRVSGVLTVPGSAAMRLRPLRVAGQLIETVDVVTPLRAIARGEVLQVSDVIVERRPRDGLPTDAAVDVKAVVGKAARRALSPAQPLRAADLQRQELIARNELVTVVYEAPGLMLTMRGRAQEAGAQGDMIAVQNVHSRKVLQALVLGPGRVAVSPTTQGRVAAAN